MAAQAAEQQRAAQESELNLTRRLRQAESAQAAATEGERQSLSQAQRAEVAASLAKQALLKAQAGLQENKTKLHLEQQKTAELQVSCKARLKSALPSSLKHHFTRFVFKPILLSPCVNILFVCCMPSHSSLFIQLHDVGCC